MAILLVLKDAAREVYRRLMDAVDPALVDPAEAALRGDHGVVEVGAGAAALDRPHAARRVRRSWWTPALTVVQAHAIAVDAEHALIHAVPRLTAAIVHADPALGPDADDPHLKLVRHMT